MQKKKSITIGILLASALLFSVWWQRDRPHNVPTNTSSAVSPGQNIPLEEIKWPDTEPWQENFARGMLWELHNTCDLFWRQEGEDVPCTLKSVTTPPYRFSLTPSDRAPEEGRVAVEVISANKDSFRARASHDASPVWWTIDADGETSCSLGNRDACYRITHLSREEVLEEVRHFVGDVPDNTRAIEFIDENTVRIETD